jgi:SAM-dependent methyltransferase
VSVSAIQKWANDLSLWAVPKEILDQAEVAPWIHPPALFQIPEKIANSPSHDIAREVVPAGGTVLDIGCGGGLAAFAISPPAHTVIGVDHQSEMLEMFRANANERGLKVETVEGFWPDVADQTPIADVVTIHHVLYNVSDIKPFIEAANSHARKRVVVEIPLVHPMSNTSSGWKFFWNIDRPTSPTADDVIKVLAEMNINAHIQKFVMEVRSERDPLKAADFLRTRLCLPSSRLGEVEEFLLSHPLASTRELAVIWWDTLPA